MRKKRKSSAVEDALSELTEALSEREKDLDAREKKLREERERFDIERSAAYGHTAPSDVLHLNVGGTKTTVLRRTLTSVPGSMLAARFSGRWDDNLEKDKDGNFYIEQNFDLFDRMLRYLRNKANGVEKYPIESPQFEKSHPKVQGSSEDDFYRMIEYYGMTDGIYPTKLTPVGSNESIEVIGSRQVNAREWSTFRLTPHGHNGRVKTYEVTLGKVQGIKIGWTANEEIGHGFWSGVAAGDAGGGFALDLTKSSFLEEGESISVDRLEYLEGTIVRSEDYGMVWYVNGELITPFAKEKQDLLRAEYSGDCFPVISVKGEIAITFVELEKKTHIHINIF